MIALEAAGTIQGSSTNATEVTYTITGEQNDAGVISYLTLAQGQLPSSVGVLYTGPASTATLVSHILICNTDNVSQSIALYINGTTAAHQIFGAMIPANGNATFDRNGWKVYDSNGNLQLSPSPLVGLAEGSLIYGKGSAVAAALAIGAQYTLLQSSGTDPEWELPTNGYGITGFASMIPPTPAVDLTSSTNQITSDVTMTNANTFYNGAAVTVGAGTWLLAGTMTMVDSVGIANFTTRIFDGSNDLIDSEQGSSGAGDFVSISLVWVVSPVGSTTYTLQGANDTDATGKIKTTSGNGTANKATSLIAVRIA